MRIECWIPKATNTYSEYVILIIFPRQKRLRERASVLCLYVHCLSCYKNDNNIGNFEGHHVFPVINFLTLYYHGNDVNI